MSREKRSRQPKRFYAVQRVGWRDLDSIVRIVLNAPMIDIGSPLEMEGTLVRDGAGFALRGERGVLYHLQLRRVPVDHVEKRVRIVGILIGERLIEAEGVGPA